MLFNNYFYLHTVYTGINAPFMVDLPDERGIYNRKT